jgi:hypothetical protein
MRRASQKSPNLSLQHPAPMLENLAAHALCGNVSLEGQKQGRSFQIEEVQMRIEARALAALAAILIVNPMPAAAQQWPDKPVRILVPFPPGGGTDIQARLLSVAFQTSMRQNFIIDNRTGASGLIATQLAVDSAPDGNTILFTSGSISVVATLYAKRMKFDVNTDLAPVSWISSTPLVLSLHPSVPVKSVKEIQLTGARSVFTSNFMRLA